MTPQAVRAALEGHLNTSWTATPISWPNVDFKPPNGAAWIRPTFKPGETFVAECCENGLGRRTGVFIIQVFTPANTGAGDADTMAGQLEALYRRKTIGGVNCEEPYTRDAGQTVSEAQQKKAWYQVNVIVPWWAWTGE